MTGKLKADSLSSALRETFDHSLRCAVDFASVKGASSWLTTLPLGLLYISLLSCMLLLYTDYGWSPLRVPSLYACGSSFSVEHVLSCPKGGLPSLRHNDIRDLTTSLLTEVCSQVIIIIIIIIIISEQSAQLVCSVCPITYIIHTITIVI